MNLYVDSHGRIQKEPLRVEVEEKLRQYQTEAGYLTGDRHRKFWETLHQRIVDFTDQAEKSSYLGIESQLVTLPTFIETWRTMAVSTPEAWEFFIMTKAQEIMSGDQTSDYYWALSIRHDQMVALVRVIQTLIRYLKLWVADKPQTVLDDDVFWGLSDYPVEKQVYLEAEKVHQERERSSH